jgi:soluble lytic murein transglycosylase-like protein
VRQWCSQIEKTAQEVGLPANLIAAVILQESGGDPTAYSSSGAVGLMQVMPRDGLAAAFMCINGPCFASRPTIAELEDPAFNIAYGSQFLAGLVQKHGSYREALYKYGPIDIGYHYADLVLGIWDAHQ